MDTERKWAAITPKAFTATGGQYGQISIASTVGFKVKQKVQIKGASLLTLQLEIKAVNSDTSLEVGPVGKITERTDLTAYIAGSTIEAPRQDRPSIDIKEHERFVYAEEPIMAKRVIPVDRFGNYFHTGNPIPVQLSDGSINIGVVEANLEVHSTHLDDSPVAGRVHDSIRIGDGVTQAKIDPKNRSFSTNRYEKLLGFLANMNFMKLANPEAIVPSFAGDTATVEYLQAGNVVGRAIARFVDDSDWDITLESYINNDDGSILLDDDGTPLFLD